MATRRKVLISSIGIGVLVTVGTLTVVGLVTAMYGRVSGEEFAPDTFQRRTYSYFELPLLRIKVTRTWRSTTTPQLTRLLTTNKYITTTSPPTRWDLVITTRSGRKWREGDARILSQYLDAHKRGGESFWLDWTSKNVPMAKVLWPEVAKLARGDLYFLVSELFETAASAQDVATLQRDLNHVLASSYVQLAETETKLKNVETAVRFFTKALTYEPDHPNALAGRAACYDVLGRMSDAAEDRSRIHRP